MLSMMQADDHVRLSAPWSSSWSRYTFGMVVEFLRTTTTNVQLQLASTLPKLQLVHTTNILNSSILSLINSLLETLYSIESETVSYKLQTASCCCTNALQIINNSRGYSLLCMCHAPLKALKGIKRTALFLSHSLSSSYLSSTYFISSHLTILTHLILQATHK